jgi:hypothetical protein
VNELTRHVLSVLPEFGIACLILALALGGQLATEAR